MHEFLEVKTKYKDWFPRMLEYGFVEKEDFRAVAQKRATAQGNKTTYIDHEIKLDMAKEISMLQRNEKGKQARQYFIEAEKKWNSPEMIIKRALEIANAKVKKLEQANEEKELVIEEQKPKVLFADSVSTSNNTILVGELAKILKQNGIDTGRERLFKWLRDKGYLVKRKGSEYNLPTQKSMEMKLFEIKEGSHVHSDGHTTITKTTKVTGKGQLYFINKFLNKEREVI